MSQRRSFRTSVAVLLAVLAGQLQLCLAAAAPAPSAAEPISVQHTQNWDGIDGSWNTIPLRIGSPEQFTRAFVSTASQQTWAIFDQACIVNGTKTNTNASVLVVDRTCYEDRGRTFSTDDSSSFRDIGFYQLWLEKNLGLMGNGKYGYDDVGLGYATGDGPTLKNTTVGALITENFWLGHFGLNPKPTNFTAYGDPSPAYLTKLFEQKHIPSLAWGYTAGAQYHFDSVQGSLTLGGYDQSRFIPNDLTFGFAPDNERDIVVGVVGLHASSNTKTDVDLRQGHKFNMYIDSSIAELYLPVEVCKAFEDAFGLKYDDDTELYLVDDLLHETLLADNATVTFSLGKFSTDATVDISLPYAAFDHTARPPYRNMTEKSRYFPIRRGANESQYVLGRTFLQEAYLIVDWQRQNFSVSATSWIYGQEPDIVAITPPGPDYKPMSGVSPVGSGFPMSTIIGVSIGGGFTLAVVCCAIWWWFWRKRRARRNKAKDPFESHPAPSIKEQHVESREEDPTSPTSPTSPTDEEGSNVFPKAELPADTRVRPELSTDVKAWPGSPGLPSPACEVANTERQIFEMPGDYPTRQEADGRQLSEKESMMVRERIYNGVDAHSPLSISPVSPFTEQPLRRLASVSPSEVTMVSSRLPVSPTTPRTPRDGASLEANDTFFHFQPSARSPRDGRFPEGEDTLMSPISPLEESPRRRFSYEA